MADKVAVITGGGTGMGREPVRQLVADGNNVALCDVSASAMAETMALSQATGLPQGLRLTTYIADVADEAQVLRFRDDDSPDDTPCNHQPEVVCRQYEESAGVAQG